MTRTTSSIRKVTALYVDKLENSLLETGELLNQAETQEEHNMLNAMLGKLIEFNDRAIQEIMNAAKRLESGNV